MKRFTRSLRTRENVTDTNALRDQLLRQLTSEANALMKRLSDEFGQSLQSQARQAATDLTGGGDLPKGEASSLASFGQLLTTGVRYLTSRPRTTTDTQESSRSIDADTSFKLSRSQAANEMQILLGQGDKNA